MKWVNRALDKGAKWIVVDPRFTRTAAHADIYCPIRPGTDIAFYGGMINYIFEHDRWQHEYCLNYTNLSYLINPDYDFDVESGLFSGFDDETRTYDKATWTYQVESETKWDTSADGAYAWMKEDGVPDFEPLTVKVPKKDPTLKDKHTVYQIMKKHYSRYDIDTVCKICGMDAKTLEQVYDIYTSTGKAGKAGTILYALGQTQHSTGVGNTRSMSIIQLLLGNIGVPGGQLAALRGEPNVQGCTDMCVSPGDLTGYLKWPKDSTDVTLADYLHNETQPDGYWSNTPKFMISYLKSFFGDKATEENDYGYNWLPKVDNPAARSLQNTWHLVEQGVVKGYMFFGQNPLQSQANAAYLRRVAENLDWLVFDDMYYTETAMFWNSPENKDRKSEIKTECYFLPVASMFEKPGAILNSGRIMQWRQQAVEPAGNTKPDGQILYELHNAIKELYKKEGGVFPTPILNAKWDYADKNGKVDMRKMAWELNGYSVKGTDFDKNKPQLLDAFAKLKADGSTASACWIYTGYYGNPDAPLDPAKQNCGRRGQSNPGNLNLFPEWSFSWPANRRILYNRASCNMKGKPWNKDKAPVSWNGKQWVTNDVPDFAFQTVNAETGEATPTPPNNKAFMMRWEQNACLFSNGVNDMPIPEHYEPYESPIDNLMNGSQNNPAILFADDASIKDTRGSVGEYPYVATTYSFTEQWSSGQETHTIPALNEMIPHPYVEIGVELAQEKGIKNGDKVRVYNQRGSVTYQAMVTKRIEPLTVNGKTQYQIGLIHEWGYTNVFTQGDISNDLVPNVGDPTSFIQESKAFLVNIEKA